MALSRAVGLSCSNLDLGTHLSRRRAAAGLKMTGRRRRRPTRSTQKSACMDEDNESELRDMLFYADVKQATLGSPDAARPKVCRLVESSSVI